MIEHLNNFKGLINQMVKIEMKLNDRLQALLLLSSLPMSWDMLVVTLSNFTPERKFIVNTVTGNLLNFRSNKKKRGISMQSEVNFVNNHDRSENCARNVGHDKSRRRSKSCPG